MKLKPKITIADHFGEMEDPRVEWSIQHKLIDIITIAICAVICGADTWVDMEMYGQSKYEWLKQFLELPNGIPSHDTFSRVFSRLDPKAFQNCFLNWVKSISKIGVRLQNNVKIEEDALSKETATTQSTNQP